MKKQYLIFLLELLRVMSIKTREHLNIFRSALFKKILYVLKLSIFLEFVMMFISLYLFNIIITWQPFKAN